MLVVGLASMEVFFSAYIWHISQNGLPSSYIWPPLVRKAHPALTYNLILSKRPSTHIWPCVNTSCQNGSTLISDHVWTHHIERDLHLHPTMCKHTTSEGLCTYIWPCANTLHRKGTTLTFDHVRTHRITMALSPRLRILGNWPGASILPENGN